MARRNTASGQGDLFVRKSGRPPLRKFSVRTVLPCGDGTVRYEDHEIVAHVMFDNSDRGQGLVFRRYYDDDTRTEKVAEFQPGSWLFYKEIPNG